MHPGDRNHVLNTRMRTAPPVTRPESESQSISSSGSVSRILDNDEGLERGSAVRQTSALRHNCPVPITKTLQDIVAERIQVLTQFMLSHIGFEEFHPR